MKEFDDDVFDIDGLVKAIENYLDNNVKIAELNRWMVVNNFDDIKNSRFCERELFYRTSLYIAEYSSGHRTKEELKKLIRGNLSAYKEDY